MLFGGGCSYLSLSSPSDSAVDGSVLEEASDALSLSASVTRSTKSLLAVGLFLDAVANHVGTLGRPPYPIADTTYLAPMQEPSAIWSEKPSSSSSEPSARSFSRRP